jgi:preprotein translocase subunit SecG
MVIALTVVFVISALLLAGVVLIQDDQGEGIGGMFGGGSSSAFGSRSGNILTKATAILAAIFLATAFGVAWLSRSVSSDDIEARARVRQLEESGSGEWYTPTAPTEPAEPAEPAADASAEEPAAGTAAGAADATDEQPQSSSGQ